MKDLINIQWMENVDSTNDQAKRELENLSDLTVIAAVSQTAGRGQRGNSWLTRPGENLTFSLVVKFSEGNFGPLGAKRNFEITQAAALGVCEYLDTEGIFCKIKWPNDIYVGNRKICGMLIENSLEGGSVMSSVIGIGLNVNQEDFPPELLNPTSMRLVTGKSFSLKPELEKLCRHIQRKLMLIQSSGDSLVDEYSSRLFRLGVFNTFVDCADGVPFVGKITGVSESGRLILETQKGELKEFSFKEISFVI